MRSALSPARPRRFFWSMTLQDVLLELVLLIEERRWRALVRLPALGCTESFRTCNMRLSALKSSRSAPQVARLEASRGLACRAK